MTKTETPFEQDTSPACGDEIATFGSSPTAVAAREAHELHHLYEVWFQQVCRWISSLGGPGIDAEDLTQEVFIVVQRKLAGFDRANLAGWLYRITDLTVRDHRRRAWFRRRPSQSCDVGLDDIESPTLGPYEQLARKHREMHLYKLIRQLNPRWRDSFLLFYVVGLSGHEIAKLNGISPATVRTHLVRGRKEILDLATRLSPKGPV